MNNIIKSPVTSINVFNVESPKHNLIKIYGRPFYALTYRKSGIAKIQTEKNAFLSQKNYVTFTPKNQEYLTEVIDDTHIIAIHFDCADNNAFKTPFAFENTNQRISELFDLILKSYSTEDAYNFKCFSLLYELLYEIEKNIETTDEKCINSKMQRAKEEIDKNYSDNDFNIDKLSNLLKISPSYLRREFKKAYSISPISYLKNVRLQKAISMLTSRYYSIESIAKECGYGSTSYFIQVFHKAKGCSPSKYKEIQ